MDVLVSGLLSLLRVMHISRATLALENAACASNSLPTEGFAGVLDFVPGDWLFWIALRRIWSGGSRLLIVVKPATVVAWHYQGFKVLWRCWSRSRKIGGPRIPHGHTSFVRCVSGSLPE